MKELWNRLRARTPKFWKEVQRVLLAVAFVSGLGLSQIEQLPRWEWLDDALRMGVFAGLFGTFLAQLTKEDTKEDTNVQQNADKTE